MKTNLRTFIKHTAKDFHNQSVNPPVVRASTIIFKNLKDIEKTEKKYLKDPRSGHFNYGRDGSKVYCLNKTERSMIRADLGKSLFNKIEKQLGYVVLSRNNKVITVGHTYKRVRRK